MPSFFCLLNTPFIKFGMVGGVSAVVDLGVYNLLAIGLGWNIYLSRTISFILAALNGYILNRRWTFQSKERQVARQFGQFFVVSVVGLLLNLGIMRLLQGWVADWESEILRKNVPVLIAIGIVYFWNYFANKFWTFRENKVSSEQ